MWTGNRKSLIARWGKETEFFQKRWGKRKTKDIFEEKKEKKRENEECSSKLQRITLSSLLSIACLDLGSVRLLSQLLMSQFDRGAISFDNLIIIFHFPNHQLWWVCPWARSVRPCRFSWFCKTAGSKEMRNAANNFVFFSHQDPIFRLRLGRSFQEGLTTSSQSYYYYFSCPDAGTSHFCFGTYDKPRVTLDSIRNSCDV